MTCDGGVAQHVERVGVVALERDDGELVALVSEASVDERPRCGSPPSGDAGRDGGLGQSRPDRRGRVGRGGAVGELERGAVGKGDVEGHAEDRSFRFAPAYLAGAVDAWSLAAHPPGGRIRPGATPERRDRSGASLRRRVV